MAICPSCSKEVSLFYQVEVMFNEPALIWRKLAVSPGQETYICNNCSAWLNIAQNRWFLLYILIIGSMVLSLIALHLLSYFDVSISYSFSEFILGAVFIVPIFIFYYIWWRFVVTFKELKK